MFIIIAKDEIHLILNLGGNIEFILSYIFFDLHVKRSYSRFNLLDAQKLMKNRKIFFSRKMIDQFCAHMI